MPAVDKTPLMNRILAIVNNPVTLFRGATLRGIFQDLLDSVPFRGASNASDPAGTIYQGDGTGLVTPSSLTENGTEVASTKSVQLPDTSLDLGNWRLLSQGQIVGIQNLGDSNRMFYPIASELTSAGAQRPRWFAYGAEQTFPSVPDTSENSGAVSTLQFVFLSTDTVRATQFRLNSSGTATNVNVQVRLTSHATEPPIFDFARANGGTGFDLVNGENLIDLPIPLFILANTSLFFTISTPSGTFTLLGETITAMGPSQFVPFTDVVGRAASSIENFLTESSSVTDLSDVTSAGSGAIITSAERTKLAGIVAALNSTNVPVDGAVTSGVWNRTSFDGVHFLLDSSQVTGDITSINAASGTAFGSDTFFAISNLDSSDRDFTLDASLSTFSGLGSDRTISLPARSCTIFFVDLASPAPIANFSVVSAASTPIIVARDTPSVSVLAEVAAASQGGNTGFWLVANNQIESNEQGVSSAIQIRALVDGLLDLNGDVLPTANVNKNTIVLEAGTQVRVFSSTDLRVVSTPSRSPTARYPDVFIISNVIVNSQAIYNLYRNRTVVATPGTGNTTSFTLAALTGTTSAAFLNRDDVFCFRNDGDGNFAITVGDAADSFSNGETAINLGSGEYLCVSPAPTGVIYTILQSGQFTELRDTFQQVMLNDWYRDEVNALAADTSVRLHNLTQVTDSGNVRDHVKSVIDASNPVTLRFQGRNIQDDVAWFEWWATFEALTPLGTTLQEIEANLPTGLATIESTVIVGYDFEFNDPGVNFAASSITFVSGNTYRVALPSTLPNYIVTGDVVVHSAFANAQNNGTFSIDAIAGDRLSYDVTINPNNGATSNETPGGLVVRTIFADVTAISNTLRQVSFNLYSDSGRTSLVTTIPDDWFDTETDPVPASNVLNIGYNTDVSVAGSTLAVEDDAGDFFAVRGGPRRSIFYFDNVTPNYANSRELPLSFEDVVINTDGLASFFLPIFPDEMEVGEVRRYRIHAHPDVSGNDIDFQVGRSGDTITFDEGFSILTVLPDKYQDIEVYNDGVRNGARLASPLQRSISSVPVLTTPAAANTITRLPVSIIDVPNSQNEDIDFRFFNTTGNQLLLQANGDYTLEASVVVQFAGTEPASAFLFSTIQLLPVVTRNSVATNLTQFEDVVSLELERGGLSGSGAPKPRHTLRCRFDWQGEVGDLVQFQPIFISIPPGFSASDFEYRDSRWAASVNLRLD